MDIGVILCGGTFILVGIVMFYASVIDSSWSLAPKFTTFLSFLFVFMGVCVFVKPIITVMIVAITIFVMLSIFTFQLFTKPFIYCWPVRGTYRKQADDKAYDHHYRYTSYYRVFMEYEYKGQLYQGFSENSIDNLKRKYKDGKQYRIYVNPYNPEKFVTKKWGGFFGSFFLILFLFSLGATILQYLFGIQFFN